MINYAANYYIIIGINTVIMSTLLFSGHYLLKLDTHNE